MSNVKNVILFRNLVVKVIVFNVSVCSYSKLFLKISEQVFDCGSIYCEAEYKPTGWKKNFAVKDAKVYWASEWE